jgi:hypothetical protein
MEFDLTELIPSITSCTYQSGPVLAYVTVGAIALPMPFLPLGQVIQGPGSC